MNVYVIVIIMFSNRTSLEYSKKSIECSYPCTRVGDIYHPQRSCEGYVFTGVCLSTGGLYPSMPCKWYPSMPCSRSLGGVCSRGVPALGGSASGGGCGDPPESRWLLLRMLRIQLECILVSTSDFFLRL